GREQIFAINLSKMSISDDVSVKKLAEATDGYSGAEIKNLCTEAGMLAIRDSRDTILVKDFENAKKKIDENKKGKGPALPANMFV
ncbi:MAG: proteasome-activating nucleotidase, partial [Candidatus Methanomethylophilaceae archaeon]|nr:proteasome-activating nucleotidase [Candidatus Methanomethylophilaceae archaeon]